MFDHGILSIMQNKYTQLAIVAVLFAIGGFLVGASTAKAPASSVTGDTSVAPTSSANQASSTQSSNTVPTTGATQASGGTSVKPSAPYTQPIVAGPQAKFTPSTATTLIHIAGPFPNTVVSPPFRVTGEAVGSWYFEATFPIILKDSKGNIIASTHATANGNWMTEKFVPFEANVTFLKQPSGSRGTLVLKKDNPSGLPANDASVEIPVVFK